jgi:hypothetical protein
MGNLAESPSACPSDAQLRQDERARAHMKKAGIIFGLAVALLAGIVAWQIATCYVANSELQSDMKDLAVQNGARIGLNPANTEAELRDIIIAQAKEHGILLEPQQVTVQRTYTPDVLSVSLATDYEARVNLLAYSFTFHFTPSSSYSAKVIVK